MVRQVGYYRFGQSCPRERVRGGYPRRDRRDVSYLFGPVVISGTVCWGHDSGVAETNVRDFSGNWNGTGSVSGSGDSETLTLASGEYMESEVVNVGATKVNIAYDDYASGSGPAGTMVIKYKDGATQAACEADTWHTYTGPFVSTGYVKIRLEAP